VPGDFSSAAFVVAAAVLVPGSQVTIEQVGINPTRTGLIDILADMGAKVRVYGQLDVPDEPVGVITVEAGQLRACEVCGDLIPRAIDELPLVAVLATQAEGETVVRDAGELRVKESDRIVAMTQGLRAMGADIEERDDGWVIRGPRRLRGAGLAANLDHRIAMALAVAGLVAQDETIIEGAETVATSFPEFADVMASLGAAVTAQ
jgi:3-phosphoshikimate 1-carboxyvinyltransferase